MTKRWIAKWHYTASLTPYKPNRIKRWWISLYSDLTWMRMVKGHAYIRIDTGIVYAEKNFDGVANLMWCEYTDVYGEWQIVQVNIGEENEDGVLQIQFTKPVVIPNEKESVYLKIDL